jgi:hypothetical protein
LNRGPLAPKASALPGCATPRKPSKGPDSGACGGLCAPRVPNDLIVPSFSSRVQPESSDWPGCSSSGCGRGFRSGVRTGCCIRRQPVIRFRLDDSWHRQTRVVSGFASPLAASGQAVFSRRRCRQESQRLALRHMGRTQPALDKGRQNAPGIRAFVVGMNWEILRQHDQAESTLRFSSLRRGRK